MGEPLAGVTLVAFANGASELILLFTESGEGEEVSMMVGTTFGSGLFITCILNSIMLLNSKNGIKV